MAVKLNGFANVLAVGKVYIGDKAVLESQKPGKNLWKKIQIGINDGASTIYVEASNTRTDKVKYVVTEGDKKQEFEVTRPFSGKMTESTDPQMTLLRGATKDLADIGYGYRRVVKLQPTREGDTIKYGLEITFIDNYDFVNFLCENKESLKDRKVKVMGGVKFDEYDNKPKVSYEITSIIEVLDDEEIHQDVPLQIELPFVADKTSLSKKDFDFDTLAKKDCMDRIVDFNVKVVRWDSLLKRNMLYPFTLNIDLTKFSYAEENKVATQGILDMYYTMFSQDNEKKEFKKDKSYEGVAVVEYFSAKGKVELDEIEKLQIQLGMIDEITLVKEKQFLLKGAKQTLFKFRRFKAGGTFVLNKDIDDKDNWIFERDELAPANTTPELPKTPIVQPSGEQPSTPVVEKGLEALKTETPSFQFKI